jgi:hypothetical protein
MKAQQNAKNAETQTTSTLTISELNNIQEYLDRMTADAEAVNQRLLDAPIDMTGKAEPQLFKLMGEVKKHVTDIQSKLAEARKIWKI